MPPTWEEPPGTGGFGPIPEFSSALPAQTFQQVLGLLAESRRLHYPPRRDVEWLRMPEHAPMGERGWQSEDFIATVDALIRTH
jgi:hypothetical protein